MEVLAFVTEVGALSERQYTDSQGQPQVFAERYIGLNTGLSTLYAALTGDAARRAPGFEQGNAVRADLSMRARTFDTKDGQRRYQTDVYIDKIAKLW